MDIKKILEEAKKDPAKREHALIIEARMKKADKTCSKSKADAKKFYDSAVAAGVAGHDLGCLCEKCKGFWGEGWRPPELAVALHQKGGQVVKCGCGAQVPADDLERHKREDFPHKRMGSQRQQARRQGINPPERQ